MKKTNQNRTKLFALAAAAALLTAASPAAQAQTPKTDAAVAALLAAKTAHGSCAVIAKIDGDLTPARQARLAALGADVTRRLDFIHSVALTLPRRSLTKLAALPFISHISYDGEVKKSDAFTDGSSGAASARQQYGLTGRGVTVAVIDSGINCQHWDLSNGKGAWRTLAYPDFIKRASTSGDYCGHGSHVAGIIAGDGTASTGLFCTHTFYGVAPQANLVSLRVLDRNGASTVSAVLAALQWMITNKTVYNIRVANLSLGHPVGESYKTDPLCQAVEAAWKAGIVVVCAAGNNGRASLVSTAGAANEGWGTSYGSIQSPGNDPYVITVGATKSMDGVRGDDRIATYSSRGPSRLDFVLKPDIIAPGNKVISLDVDQSTLNTEFAATNLLPLSAYTTAAASATYEGMNANNQAGAGYSNAYFVLSGTSMAAPVVSGAAALMLQADPSLTPDTVKARLMTSADKWLDPTGTADLCTYGAGCLDIPAALASTVTPTQPALSPQISVVNGDVIVSTSIIGSTSVWGSKAITGVNAIYGSKAVTGVSTIYSSKAVTGVSTIASSKAICGSSVWADTSLSSSSSAAVDLSSVAISGE